MKKNKSNRNHRNETNIPSNTNTMNKCKNIYIIDQLYIERYKKCLEIVGLHNLFQRVLKLKGM